MKFNYVCTDCHASYEITPDLMCCPKCYAHQKADEPLRGVLEVELNGEAKADFEIFDLLPVEREFFPSIPVGNTPMWHPKNLVHRFKMPNLYFKDDSSNPTGSFKDRASYLVAAFATKHQVKDITLASTGNAGSSMAGIGAAAGINITLFLPKSAPPAKMIQALQFGAKVIAVDGNYDNAYDLSMEYSKKCISMNRNTAYNPMTIEGKKTVSLEMFKQLKHAPDFVFVPTGDGCIIAGVYKGFQDLLKLQLIKKMPTIYCVQAANSDALTRAFNNGGKFENKPTSTIADSICVDVPRNGFHALKFLQKYEGRCVTVSDQEILEAQKDLSSHAGLFTEPAGACSYAGFLKVKDQLPANASIVVMTTGSGLKDTNTASKGVKMPTHAIKSLQELFL